MSNGIDVVVVNYRTPDDAQGFLDSYVESRISQSSLWVANVDPTERDADVVDLALLNMTGEYGLVTWDDNVGYARACNRSANYGHRDIIGFFNADTRLSPQLLEELVVQFDLNPHWAIVGPRQYDDNNLITHAGIFGTEAQPKLRGWKEQDIGQYNDIDETAVSVSGSAYFIRRSVWQMLTDCPIYRQFAPDADGAFLPTQHYYEETWCSYHARAHGLKVVYYGAVGMLHRWHQASPVGGYAERIMPMSQQMFRDACDLHAIAHD